MKPVFILITTEDGSESFTVYQSVSRLCEDSAIAHSGTVRAALRQNKTFAKRNQRIVIAEFIPHKKRGKSLK